GLHAIQAQMQVISSNITNAQRDDYTAKNIILTADTTTPEGTGGVSVVGYNRATDNDLSKLYNQSLSDVGLTGTEQDYLNRVQTLLGSSQSTPVLTNAMNDFANAWRSYAAAPEDATLKQDVIFKAQNLASEVQRLATGVDQIKSDAQTDMQT